MRMSIAVLALVLAGTGSAAGQSNPVYLGATMGVNGGSRGPVDVGSVGTTGGVFGIRLSKGWSVEFEADRGFGKSERDDGETFWVSYAPPGSSREEVARLAVRARFVRIDRARAGYSAHVVWKTRERGRLNAAFYGGVSQWNFDKRVVRTITHIPEEGGIPSDDPNVRDADETRTITGGGPTGGVMILGRITDRVTIAPDVRLTLGLITDESTYKILSAGVRLMWGF